MARKIPPPFRMIIMVCGIYLIENNLTHQLYVGQSVDVKERWRHHRDNPNEGSRIDEAIRQYGPENFSLTMITELPKNAPMLDVHEKYWIKFYDTFNNRRHYNLTVGGQGMGVGKDHPSFKGYYRIRKGQINKNGKRNYKLVNPNGEVILHSIHKDNLLKYADDLENGIITEDDLFKKNYVIVKHGFVYGKQRYVLKSPEGEQLKHSYDIKKLEALKEKYESEDLQ